MGGEEADTGRDVYRKSSITEITNGSSRKHACIHFQHKRNIEINFGNEVERVEFVELANEWLLLPDWEVAEGRDEKGRKYKFYLKAELLSCPGECQPVIFLGKKEFRIKPTKGMSNMGRGELHVRDCPTCPICQGT